jgi:hypothetical protein
VGAYVRLERAHERVEAGPALDEHLVPLNKVLQRNQDTA